MSLAELVITAVKVEGRTRSEVARDYRVSRYWVHRLVKRFEAEGEAAFQPRSRCPHTRRQVVGPALEDRIVRLRKELSKKGWDAGAETIRVHLLRDLASRDPRSRVPRRRETGTASSPALSAGLCQARGLLCSRRRPKPARISGRMSRRREKRRSIANTRRTNVAAKRTNAVG